MTFGERLRDIRKKRGMTQKELGTALGLGEMTVSGYETSVRHPDFEKLIKIAQIFETTTDYLLGVTMEETIRTAWIERAIKAESKIKKLEVIIEDFMKIFDSMPKWVRTMIKAQEAIKEDEG